MSIFELFSLLLAFSVQGILSYPGDPSITDSKTNGDGDVPVVGKAVTARVVNTINTILTDSAKRELLTQYVDKVKELVLNPNAESELNAAIRNVNAIFSDPKNVDLIERSIRRQAGVLENEHHMEFLLKIQTELSEVLASPGAQKIADTAARTAIFVTTNADCEKLVKLSTKSFGKLYVARDSFKLLGHELADLMLNEQNLDFMKKITQKIGPLAQTLFGPTPSTVQKKQKKVEKRTGKQTAKASSSKSSNVNARRSGSKSIERKN